MRARAHVRGFVLPELTRRPPAPPPLTSLAQCLYSRMAFLASPEADRVTVEVALNEDQVRMRPRARARTRARANTHGGTCTRACRLTHAHTC